MVKWKTRSGLSVVLVLIAAVVISARVPLEFADSVTPFADDPSRLPTSVIPVHYDLSLRALTGTLYAGTRAYSGSVKIHIRIVTNTNSITLHSRGLTISSISLMGLGGGSPIATTFTLNTSYEFLVVNTASTTLSQGQEFSLEINFTGNMRTDMGGFYRSSYRPTGETVSRYLGATQFQSTSARSAFPNFDEPALKATFTISITHGSDYSAISNTEGTSIVNGDGTITTTFQRSPIMSSYLNAWVISDFASRSLDNGPQATKHAIYARLEDVENVKSALDHSFLFLKQLEDYCSYEYELSKMYSAAIPDFAAGAMENWGLILYREYYLINDEKSHPRETFDMLRISAHELAHQFFGNLVTYDWWDKIWMNEGFATFFEYFLVELTYPQARMKDHFNVRKTQNAFRRDSLHSTRPMTYEGSKPNEINYDKGGAVIRMFQYAIGDDLFRTALNRYLMDNHHRPVATHHLLAAFETILAQAGVNNLNFSAAFVTWELQSGYPVIDVRYDVATQSFYITQKKYLSVTEEPIPDDPASWYIPLSYTTAANPNFENTKFSDYFVNNQAFKSISAPGFNGNDWYIFNLQQMGYYRVNYDISNWQEIVKVLNSPDFTKIHVLNRAQLVDDALTMAFDGYLSYDVALGIANYLFRETDYMPWYPAVIAFDKIDYLLKGTPLHSQFTRYVRKMIRRFHVTYGTEIQPDDGVLEHFARELGLDWTCRLGDQRCLDNAYRELMAVEDLPPPLQITFLCNAMKGPNREWEFVHFHKHFRDSTDQAERLRYLDGLTCSGNQTYIVDLLQSTLGSEIFYRSHERSRIYSNVWTRSAVGLQSMMQFIVQLYNEIISVNGNVIDGWFITASRRAVTYDDEKLIVDTMNTLQNAGRGVSQATRDQVMNNINFNKDWVSSTRYQQIMQFINRQLSEIDNFESQLRVPKLSEPLNYKIHIDVRNAHSGALPYTGEVEIDIAIKQTTDKIFFHSKTQQIDELEVFDKAGAEIQVLDYSLQTAADSITIYFMKEIPAGTQIYVTIKYSTRLLTSSTGFYRTAYTQDEKTKYLAATQFQPTSARYAFPHYDEPGYKTPFELSITHHQSYHAIANTFGIRIPNGDGTVTTVFERTPIMSSYLLAFVVSEFANITNEKTREPKETLHRVWTKPDSISKAPFALENSVKALKALEEYCYFDYVLPKVDSAAIPNKNSAMENWGMVTYWETAMIYEENYDDIPHNLKFSGVRVIGHELAHQFFGDAVTCEWWDQIWLNEGFATLFQYVVVDMFYPAWRMYDFMTVFTRQNSVFISDSRDTTRPMTNDVLTLTQISNSFDNVAYDKSGCVLRMFQNALGENIFRRSLELYLKTKNLQPVISQDLVDAVTTTMQRYNLTTFEFDRALRSWEHQRGYPLISVRYDIPSQSFQVTQQRYFEFKKSNSNDTSSWYIPLNYATSSNPNFDTTTITDWFVNGDAVKSIPAATFTTSQWYVFNKQQTGYYRVHYADNNWRALSYALNSADYTRIHVMNRVQLIDDSFALAIGGYVDYQLAFDIVKYLPREDDFFPFYTAYRYLNPMYTIFGNRNQVLKNFMRYISEKYYNKFKLPTNQIVPVEDVVDRYGRNYAISIACNAGNQQCLDDAYYLVKHYAHSDRKMPNGLELLYCHGLRGDGKTPEFVAIWNKMSLMSSTLSFKATLINALGCTDNLELQWAYLDSTLGSNPNNVNYTQNERRNVFGAIVANSYTSLPTVLDFIAKKENEVLSSQGRTLQQVLTVVAQSIKNAEDQILFHSFLLTRNNLDAAGFKAISVIVGNNMEAQKQIRYATSIKEMERVIYEWENVQIDEAFAWVLPRTSIPEHYHVHLNLRNVQTGTRAFEGEVSVDVLITQNTNRIMMHSKNQEIISIRAFNRDTSATIPIMSRRMTPNVDTMLIVFNQVLTAGTKINVYISYQASLVTQTTGMYQTSYTVDSQTRYLVATQFEEVGARYAFPCYDEPEYKAVFEVKITHDQSMSAFANTMETVTNNLDGTLTSTFLPSPVMSTYLNAFLVADFDYIDNSATRKPGETYQRIISRKNAVNFTQYGLDNSILALKALESYANFNYEITKMDSAAVPNKGNAMENWGLIKYRENALIFTEDINDSPHTQIFSGVRVISHEVAHQFFGNVVTCKWWNYIWLNEGFAQLLQYTLTDMFHPDWRFIDYMNTFAMQGNAFIVDARTTARSMTVDGANILTPDDFGRLFDTIAYDKSANVIRTFEHAIGENNFRESLNLYLNTKKNQPVVSQDLMDAFTTTLRKNNFNLFDFDTAFRTWENQRGFPLLHVHFNQTASTFVLTQERFFEQKSYGVNDKSSWFIPLNYYTATVGNVQDTRASDTFVNTSPSKQISIPGFTIDQWVIFNKQQRGYYRVNYDDNNWRALSLALNGDNYNKIHVMNRAQLIDDSFALVGAGYHSDYQNAYDILKYLVQEDDFFVWYAANRRLNPLKTAFGFKDETLNKFIRKLAEKYYRKYKLDASETIPVDILPERYGRFYAIQLACESLETQCLEDTYRLVYHYAHHDRKIPAGLESLVLCNGFRGPEKESELVAVWRKMSLTASSTLKSTLISSLGCSDNEEFLYDYLESSLGSSISQVNYTTAQRREVFNSVLRSHSGLPVIITFLKNHESRIISAYQWTLYTTLSTVAGTVKNREDQALFSDYLATVSGLTGDQFRSISQMMYNNLALQSNFIYANQMHMIKGVLDEWEFGVLDGHQWRLPHTSRPEYYRIHLDVRHIHNGTLDYKGEVSIDISMLETTNRILFHSKSQVIDEVKVYERGTTREIKLRGYRLFPSADTILLFFENVLSASARITVNIKYSTKLLTAAYGFYQTSYVMDGRTRYVGATQFEPARARYAFPGYDEPEFKTPYDLKITHDSSVKAHANTMETIVVNSDGTTTTSFAPSPIMSSYLLAFAISDFEFIDNKDTMVQRNETYQRIIVRADGITRAPYALENSIKTLEALENYVNYKYEINKLDSIGVPQKGGAMENWGFITYAESAMIYEENPDEIAHWQKMSGVRVIAHEIAHQFFGNSVTCKWWNYIWLNEGFATLLQYSLVDEFLPNWRMQHLMTVLTVQGVAFISDARTNTRPMTYDAETPAEISAVFDNIAYSKSGSVLRMFQYAVGDTIFKDALNLYIKTNDHKPAESQQLMDAFTQTLRAHNFNDFDFDSAFRTWENQRGYPYLDVLYNSQSNSFELTQHRFFEQKNLTDNTNPLWVVPINYATQLNPNFEDTKITNYFNAFPDTYMISAPNPGQWYVFNKQQIGYYRVNYDSANWIALRDALKSNNFNQIHVMNRAQLIDDSFAFANAGYHDDYILAFDIMSYLERETDFFPFHPANRYLSNLYNIFGRKNAYLNTFVHDISGAFYNKYKLTAENKIPVDILPERFGREYAINLACNSGNQQCLQDAFTLVYMFANSDQKVPNGLESLYCAGFRGEGKQEEFTKIWFKMQVTADTAFKKTLINALGCTDNHAMLVDYLHTSLGSGNSVNYTQAQRRSVFTSTLQSHTGLPTVTNFIKNYYTYMQNSYGWSLQTILTQVANTIKTEQDQLFFLDFMLSLESLSGDAFRALTKITSDNLARQKLPQNVAQMHALKSLNPDIIDPKENSTTVSPLPTFTAPTNIPSTTTTRITTSSSTTSRTTSSISSSSSSSSSIQSTNPTTPTTSTIPTSPPPVPATTPSSSTNLKVNILIITIALTVTSLWKN